MGLGEALSVERAATRCTSSVWHDWEPTSRIEGLRCVSCGLTRYLSSVTWHRRHRFARSKDREPVVAQLAQRDGYCCFYCGVEFGDGLPWSGETVEHRRGRAAGGSGRLSNLALACEYCNSHKAKHHAGDSEAAYVRSAAYRQRRLAVKGLLRKQLGLHPKRDAYWHDGPIERVSPRGSFVVLCCEACGTVGTEEEPLGLTPCAPEGT